MNIIREKIVKTRKEHYCEACYRKFPKGTEMNSQTITDGGEIYTFRTCPTCMELLSNYPDEFMNCDNCFDSGCVKERAEGVSPEELLESLKTVENYYKIISKNL